MIVNKIDIEMNNFNEEGIHHTRLNHSLKKSNVLNETHPQLLRVKNSEQIHIDCCQQAFAKTSPATGWNIAMDLHPACMMNTERRQNTRWVIVWRTTTANWDMSNSNCCLQITLSPQEMYSEWHNFDVSKVHQACVGNFNLGYVTQLCQNENLLRTKIHRAVISCHFWYMNIVLTAK